MLVALHRDHKLVGEYLTKVDGATSHYGLEARSPFLDQRIWEFAEAIPPEIRLRNGTKKAVLRAVAERRLGPRVARGRKQGFTVPVERWLAGPWRSSLLDHLHDSALEREGYLNVGPLVEQLRERKDQPELPTHFWYVLVLERWMRRHIVQ